MIIVAPLFARRTLRTCGLAFQVRPRQTHRRPAPSGIARLGRRRSESGMRAHLGAERRLPWRGCDNFSVTLPATMGPQGATGRPPLIAAPARNIGLRPQHGTTGLRGREAAWLGRVFAGLTGVVPLGPSETFSKRWPGDASMSASTMESRVTYTRSLPRPRTPVASPRSPLSRPTSTSRDAGRRAQQARRTDPGAGGSLRTAPLAPPRSPRPGRTGPGTL